MMIDSCAERASLEDGGEITIFRLEVGCHTFGASIFDGTAITLTYTIAYKLRVASKCIRICSCAKFQVQYCAACKCKGNYIKCGHGSNACSDSC